jgi:transcriptional regulator with XRE-family HTH domain
MAFGKKIKQIRLQQGLTQAQVAKTLGYESSSYVSDVEIGKFIPTPDKLSKLAHALGVTNTEMTDLLLEEKLETLGISDPAFTMMFKEIPHMTTEEKQSLIRAYEAVIRARGQKRHHEKSSTDSGGDLS